MSRVVYKIQPDGWPCTIRDCPPGFFGVPQENGLMTFGFKTEYRDSDGYCEVYNYAGEVFWEGEIKKERRDKLIVQPVTVYMVAEET